MQTRIQSFIEVSIGLSIGYTIAVFANWIVIPWFGYAVTLSDSAGIGFIFTIISLIRSYLIRRLFNYIHRK